MTDLLPCPFCNSINLYEHHHTTHCISCGAQADKEVWNNRVRRDLAQALKKVYEYEAALEHYVMLDDMAGVKNKLAKRLLEKYGVIDNISEELK